MPQITIHRLPSADSNIVVSPFLLKQVCLTLQTSPPVGLRLEKRKKVSAPAMVVAAAMTAMPAAAVAAVAAGPMSSAAAAAALTQPGTPALAAALRGRHRLGGAKLQPALAALRARGPWSSRGPGRRPRRSLSRLCVQCSGWVRGRTSRLPCSRAGTAQRHCAAAPPRHSRLLHRRCVVLGVFAVLAVFAPKGTEESHCVLLSHSSVFVRSHKISPPEQPQLEFSVQDLKIHVFTRTSCTVRTGKSGILFSIPLFFLRRVCYNGASIMKKVHSAGFRPVTFVHFCHHTPARGT